MYAIREESPGRRLTIELNGRVTTEEALRAMSQAFSLVEASGLRAVRCDVTGIRRGPGGLLLLAAALAVRYRHDTRVAFLGDDTQLRLVTRLIRFSGIRGGLRAFDSAEDADGWLAPVAVPARPRLSATARRHARELLAASREAAVASSIPEARVIEPAA